MLSAAPCFAGDAPAATADSVQLNLNIVWTCVAAFLVFFMQAGFACVETGFTRAKNAVNIMMKNLMDFVAATLVFFLVGFGLMFGKSNGFFGTTLFGMSGVEPGDSWDWTFLMFQTVFAGTSATIVSGAMAERTKFVGYLIYSAFISLLIYPIFGSWAWGNLLITDNCSWLANMGFHDFAGSTVVHSIGGWLALAGAVVLGPRIGKYRPDGKPAAIIGHNLPLAALGVFILWFGWFGFNPGSTTVGSGLIGYIAITTNLAAAGGALAAIAVAWGIFSKPDASMALNGALAGLVAITAGCDTVSPLGAIIIGLCAGVLVVLAVTFIDRILKIDDPVGAVSVHGVCGAFGTLAVGLFSMSDGLLYTGSLKLLGTQALGVATAFAWAFVLGMILFTVINKTIGLRVSREEELRGLDIGEHGMEAYAGFQIFSNI
ncbi:MAG TPA: ammonium transporter [Phycisphaerae bacterium]|nr:ammonium transporter [Phycisphaerae bacterium]HPS51941.1 ammonium transporter [Phycisphaerae bacterium]